MPITFSPLKESHFPLLLKWLEAPHVKKWWDQDVAYTMDLVREKYSSYIKGYKEAEGAHNSIHAFIIHDNQEPVGYIQIYNAHDFPREKPLPGLPETLGAFDIFIGEEQNLWQSLGSRALSEFLKLHGGGYSHIFAAPDSRNIAAIKSYEKAGFKKITEQQNAGEVWMLWDNKIVSTGNAEHFVWGDFCDGWWLKKDNTFTIIEETMPPGSSETKHYHRITEQFFYVLDGTLSIEMNNHEYQLQTSQGITIPPKTIHHVFNKSNTLIRFLVISCPDSHGDRVTIEDFLPPRRND